MGHVAAVCILKANVEPHGDTVIPDMGEGEQRAATTTNGLSGEVHNSPSLSTAAVPMARNAKGLAASPTGDGVFREERRPWGMVCHGLEY